MLHGRQFVVSQKLFHWLSDCGDETPILPRFVRTFVTITRNHHDSRQNRFLYVFVHLYDVTLASCYDGLARSGYPTKPHIPSAIIRDPKPTGCNRTTGSTHFRLICSTNGKLSPENQWLEDAFPIEIVPF